MRPISENLQIIKNSELAMKQAIIDKGGTINGDITTWANSIVDIPSNGNISPEGSLSSKSKNDVNFYNYDGTILHSFSKDEFLELEEFPDQPDITGLISLNWTHDLNSSKTYVEEYGKLDIGTTYITDDGKTRLYIRIEAEGRMTVPLYFSQTVTNGVTIDWGDGSETQTLSGTGNKNTTHTYANIGDYRITLTVASGCTLGLGNNTYNHCVMGSTGSNGKVYCNMLQKVEIGTGVTSIGNYAFQYCYSLSSVVMPLGITSIGSQAFSTCSSLSSIVIPNSVTSIGGSAFYNCYGMAYYDFSNHTSVPTLSGTNALSNIPSDSKIIVPDNLYDTWKTATNWSTYASKIIKKSDWDAL
jgi:hypothetical protein